MFKLLAANEITHSLVKRKMAIKKRDKLPALSQDYLAFLLNYEGVEITPDILLYSYEEALNSNRRFEQEFAEFSKTLWMIGRSGQGDDWFISKASGEVLFYDHNQGEYSETTHFVTFDIGFTAFLQMAFLFQDLERLLDEHDSLEESDQRAFIDLIDSIRPGLFERYPYGYF